MRISVIGVGAVGGTLAALLHRAGHDVHGVARGATLEAIRRDGVKLRTMTQRFSAQISVGAEVSLDAEAVLIAVRTYQIDAALREHAPDIGDVPVLIAQNGVRGPQLAAEVLGRSSGVYGLLSTFPASAPAAADIRLNGPGRLTIAALAAGQQSQIRALASALNDAMPTTISDNLEGLLWMKLLLNQVNALPAVTGLSVQRVCAHPRLGPLLARALEETVCVTDGLGIALERVGRLHPQHAQLIRNGHALRVVRARLGRMFGTVPNPASTLQSIRRGSPTEIDALNGEITASGHSLSVPTPVNDCLTRLVHRVEATGRHLTVNDTMRRCGA